LRNALPLLIAGTCLAILPLLGPAASKSPAGLERTYACFAPSAWPITASRDWLGSLHGWHDSALVLAWRSGLATVKGKPVPAACRD